MGTFCIPGFYDHVAAAQRQGAGQPRQPLPFDEREYKEKEVSVR